MSDNSGNFSVPPDDEVDIIKEDINQYSIASVVSATHFESTSKQIENSIDFKRLSEDVITVDPSALADTENASNAHDNFDIRTQEARSDSNVIETILTDVNSEPPRLSWPVSRDVQRDSDWLDEIRTKQNDDQLPSDVANVTTTNSSDKIQPAGSMHAASYPQFSSANKRKSQRSPARHSEQMSRDAVSAVPTVSRDNHVTTTSWPIVSAEREKRVRSRVDHEAIRRTQRRLQRHRRVTLGDTYSADSNATAAEDEVSADVWVPPDYKDSDFVSEPFVTSADDSLSKDVITFVHSFGYDCQKVDNLQMIDGNTLVFVSGNLLHIVDIGTWQVKYLRSSAGAGIGHFAVHPDLTHISIAEKGNAPPIIVYTLPDFHVHRLLRDGSEKEYVYVAFSSDGRMLCSLGAAPDFLLILWDWNRETKILRSKAFSQDVCRSVFNNFDLSSLTSAGMSHIKFWKKAQTFTGLKLQGVLGRFGKTEISDIKGFLQPPGGNVVSGCEWGNLLVWQGGVIRAEIGRRNGQPCHAGEILQMYLIDGELITLGADGWIRTWDLETIEQAESAQTAVTDTDTAQRSNCLVEPINELCVRAHGRLMSMCPRLQQASAATSALTALGSASSNEQQHMWLIQDAGGAIYEAELSFLISATKPRRVFSCPAGAVRAIACSPTAHCLFACTGDDGGVYVYNYTTRQLLVHQKFGVAATGLVWLSDELCGSSTAQILLVSFGDGCVRLFLLHTDTRSTHHLALLQAEKLHKLEITCMAHNVKKRIVVTSSLDGTLWFVTFTGQAAETRVTLLGFCDLFDFDPPRVTCMDFEPTHSNCLLVCTSVGTVHEVSVPDADSVLATDLTSASSYCIDGLVRSSWTFVSIKSELIRQEAHTRRELEKQTEREDLQKSIDARVRAGLDVDADAEFASLDRRLNAEDDSLPIIETFVPQPPNSITFAQYRTDSARDGVSGFHLLLDGWDSGLLYTAAFDVPSPAAVRLPGFHDDDKVAITVCRKSVDSLYTAMGLSNGSIRLSPHSPQCPIQTPSYWQLGMHDSSYGAVTDICFTPDNKAFLSVGLDGNIFMYKFTAAKDIVIIQPDLTVQNVRVVDDIDEPATYPTVEEMKQQELKQRRLDLAESRKASMRTKLQYLRVQYKNLLALNATLPAKLQVSREILCSNKYARNAQQRKAEQKYQQVEAQMHKVLDVHTQCVQQLQTRFNSRILYERFTVHDFCGKHSVHTMRLKAFSDAFNDICEQLEGSRNTKFPGDTLAGSDSVTEAVSVNKQNLLSKDSPHENVCEESLVNLEQWPKHLRLRRLRRQNLVKKMNAMLACRPDPDVDDPDDISAIQHAIDTMGDLKLRTSDDYQVTDATVFTTAYKRRQLVTLKQQVHECKLDFNKKVMHLKQRKAEIIRLIEILLNTASRFQQLLPIEFHVRLPNVPTLTADECPENIYEASVDELLEHKRRAVHEITAHFGAHYLDPLPPNYLAAPVAHTVAASGGSSGVQAVRHSAHPGDRQHGPSEPRGRGSARRSPHTDTGATYAEPGACDEEYDDYCCLLDDGQMSFEQMKLKRISFIRNKYERDFHLQKAASLQTEFDAQVYEVWREMHEINHHMCRAKLTQILRYQELLLIGDFEKRESELRNELLTRSQEYNEANIILLNEKRRVDLTQLEIEKTQTELKRLLESVQAKFPTSDGAQIVTSEASQLAKFLLRVYRKNVRENTRQISDGVGDAAGSADDLSDSDTSSSFSLSDCHSLDDMDSDELDDVENRQNWDLNQCPSQCDTSLYNSVVQARTVRIELEKKLVELRQSLDVSRKDLEQATKRSRMFETALGNAKHQIRQLELQKLSKLNDLDVTVTLRLDQVRSPGHCGAMSEQQQQQQQARTCTDLAHFVLVTQRALQTLDVRITELDGEIRREKQTRRDLCMEGRNLRKDHMLMDTYVEKLKNDILREMLAKFGREVDLDFVESLCVVSCVKDMQRLCEQARREADRQEVGRCREIEAVRVALQEAVQENTRCVGVLNLLTQERRRLVCGLNYMLQTKLKLCEKRYAIHDDIKTLTSIVKEQKTQIMELKHEIWKHSFKSLPVLRRMETVMDEIQTVTAAVPASAKAAGVHQDASDDTLSLSSDEEDVGSVGSSQLQISRTFSCDM